MKNYSISLLIPLVVFLCGCVQNTADELPLPYSVIPQPQHVDILKGTGLEYGKLLQLNMSGFEQRPVMGEILSRLPESGPADDGILSLVLDSAMTGINGPEGYILSISKGSAEIKATGEPGIFYGCQTLEQLLEDARDFDTSIPFCIITDYPAIAYRSVHFDVKHHLDHMNYYYESIDRLARYKINAVIFEVEDKLRYVRQPLVGAPQAISIDEMASLTRYAAERHIEISPLVQGLGHATFILKHPGYKYLREIPDRRWVSCSLEPGTYELYEDLFKDAFEATPESKYVHIGGDEIGDIGLCDRCRAKGEEIGELGLYLYWLNTICDLANASGRTPIFWDDMPLKMAGVYESTWNINYDPEQTEKDWETGEPKLDSLITSFPKNCIYMRWNYELGKLPGNIKTLDWYQKSGLQTMVSTAAQTGALLFPFDERTGNMDDSGLAAIRSFLGLAAEKKVEGMFCTAWDDKSPHFETYWRGLIASAEYSWSPEIRSLEEYDEAYLHREYGLSETDYHTFYNQLTEAASFWGSAFNKTGTRFSLENALFALPGLAHWIPEAEKDKQKDKTDFTDRLIELPDANNPGTWTDTYEPRLTEAQSIVDNYRNTSEQIDLYYKISTRNRFHWELFNVLNDFQVTAPRLLLALKQCDTNDETDKQKGLLQVQTELEEFDSAWENLKQVYAKTRFIKYPNNYVPDRYYHFASQREDLSWMIQVEELLHDMIQQWMSNSGG